MDRQQLPLVHMGINLSGCDIRVSEHLLDHAQIGSVFEQMAGEGVAERFLLR